MPRLPQPGGDDGNWGEILNEYLSQVHAADGTLKDNVVTAAQIAPNSVTATEIQDGTVTEAQLTPAVQAKLNTPPTGGTVKSVNTKTPDQAGNVTLLGADLGAVSQASFDTATSNLTTSLNIKADKSSVYTKAEADARYVRTVNGSAPDVSGNVAVSAGGRLLVSDLGAKSGTVTIDANAAELYRLTATGNIVISMSGDAVVAVAITQDTTGSRTVTYSDSSVSVKAAPSSETVFVMTKINGVWYPKVVIGVGAEGIASDTTAPSTPSGLAITAITQSSMHIAWTPGIDAESTVTSRYRTRTSTDSGATFSAWTGWLTAVANSVDLSGLAASTLVQIEVQCVSSGGNSGVLAGSATTSSPVAAKLPGDIAGIVSWFDAQQTASITKDGSNAVSSWASRVVSSDTLATYGPAPTTYSATTLAGKPGIVSAGGEGSFLGWYSPNLDMPHTMLWVGSGILGSAGVWLKVGIDYLGPNGLRQVVISGVGSDAQAFADGDVMIVLIRVSASGRVLDVVKADGTVSHASNADTSSLWRQSVNIPLNSSAVGELAFWSRTLSDTEVEQLIAGLKAKWGYA